MKIKACPCCLGEAIYADLLVKGVVMWQVSCTGCGLSSELDEDKLYTLDRWNMRQEKARSKMWITTLTTILPAASIIFFLLGVLVGAGLST